MREFCMARGPRDDGGEGRPACWLSPGHEGPHRGDARDGWEGVTWSSPRSAPGERLAKNLQDALIHFREQMGATPPSKPDEPQPVDPYPELDAAVQRAFRQAPHTPSCAVMTDGPGTPYRCTCWKDDLRLAMLHLYGRDVDKQQGDDSDVAMGRCCPHCRQFLTEHNRAVWEAGYEVGKRHAGQGRP